LVVISSCNCNFIAVVASKGCGGYVNGYAETLKSKPEELVKLNKKIKKGRKKLCQIFI
jgi:hypothetical protein